MPRKKKEVKKKEEKPVSKKEEQVQDPVHNRAV